MQICTASENREGKKQQTNIYKTICLHLKSFFIDAMSFRISITAFDYRGLLLNIIHESYKTISITNNNQIKTTVKLRHFKIR